jgi:hypothetical protein
MRTRNNSGNNVVVYIPIGIVTGVVVGAMNDNIAIGVSIGVVFGTALGTFERQDRYTLCMAGKTCSAPHPVSPLMSRESIIFSKAAEFE